jgi:O-antigen/teichoic acid export membrane protein
MIYNSLVETFKDSIWYGIATFLSRASGIILLPLYSHWFLPEEFGMIQWIIILIPIAYAIVSLQTGDAIHRFYYIYESSMESGKLIGTHLLMLSVGIAVLLLVMFNILETSVTTIMGNTYATTVLKLAIVSTCFCILNDYFSALLRLRKRVKSYLLLSVMQLILLLVTNIAFIKFIGMGYEGVFYAMMVSHGIILVAHILIGTRDIRLAVSINVLKRTLAYCYPLIIVALLEWLRMYFYQLYIGKQFGQMQLGYIAVGMRIVQIYVVSQTIFEMAWFRQSMEKMLHPRMNQLYQYFYRYSLVIFIVVFSIIALFSKEIIYLIARHEYLPAYKYIAIIFFVAFGEVLTSFFVMGILISEKTIYYMIAHIIGVSIGIPLIILLSKSYNIYGALCGAGLFSMILAFISLILANRVHRIGYVIKPLIPVILLCLLICLYNVLIANYDIVVVEMILKGIFCICLIITLYRFFLYQQERNILKETIVKCFRGIMTLSSITRKWALSCDEYRL